VASRFRLSLCRVVLATTAVMLLSTPLDLDAQILPAAPQIIRIRTTPGAEVSVDGKPAGYANADGILILKDPKPGIHKIRILKDGKKPFEQSIRISPLEKVANVSAVLADVVGDLEVLTTPGAAVSVDDKPAGRADAKGRLYIRKLAVGVEHKVRVLGEGRATQFATAWVSEGSVATISLPLEEVVRMPVSTEAKLGQLVARRSFSNPGRPPRPESPAFLGISFSPDSSKLGAYDGSRWVAWDVESGLQGLATLIDPRSEYERADFVGVSRDWRYLAVVDAHRQEGPCARFHGPEKYSIEGYPPCRFEVVVWDLTAAKVAARFADALDVSDSDYFDFSPDSRYIVLASPNNRVSVYEIATGRRLWSVQEGYLRQVVYSPRGDYVVVVRQLDGQWRQNVRNCGRGSICIREAASGKEVRVFARPEWAENRVDALVRPDGEWLAIGQQATSEQRQPAMIRLFEMQTLKEAIPVVLAEGEHLVIPSVACSAHRFTPTFAFHQTGRYVAGFAPKGGGGWVKIWDLLESREVWSLAMPQVGSLVFSPNGRWLATEGGGSEKRSLRLWEIVQ
jgi:WD40 repeat protein